jgi:hypothetical protein
MFDRDGKGWERRHPDLITHDKPRLSHEDQSQSFGFPSRKGKRLGDAFAGLLRVFWLEDKGAKSRGPLQEWNFLAGLLETYPQVAFTFVVLKNWRPFSLRLLQRAGTAGVQDANRFLLAVPPL